jgi:dGTP triphosphohydrolase
MKKIKEKIIHLLQSVKNLFRKKPKFEVKTFLREAAKNKLGIALVALALVLGLLYYYKNFFIVAMVNNQPVFRTIVIKRLETSGGKQALDGIITEMLIKQEAKRLNVTTSKEELTQAVVDLRKQLKDSGQDLDQMLSFQGMTLKDLGDQLSIQKTVEKILSEKVTVTPEELTAFITENKDSFQVDQTEQEKLAIADQQLKQQKLTTEFQKWIDVIKTKSNINYLLKY